jgi:hypothetical protein
MVPEFPAMALIGRRNGKLNRPGDIGGDFAVRKGEHKAGKPVHSPASHEYRFDVPDSREADIVFCVCEVNNGEKTAPQHRMSERPILLEMRPQCDDLLLDPA